MTFDLAVWHSERRPSSLEAQRIYEELCDGHSTHGLKANDQVRAFKREFAKDYPDLDVPGREDVAESLRPEGGEDWDHAVVLNFGWSAAEKMLAVVCRVAAKHGLICYDPQQGVVHFPREQAPASKPWWKFW